MKLSRPILALAVAAALVSCTKAEQTAVNSFVSAECVPVVSLETPSAEPICVGAEMLIQAVEEYITAHAGATPPVSAAEGATVVAPDLYKALAARAPKMSAARAKACPKCPACPPSPPISSRPGTVAP